MKTLNNARRGRNAVLICLAGAVPVVAATGATAASGADSTAKSASVKASKASLGRRQCTPPRYPGKSGRSRYLVTFHLGCATGRKLALAQYRCRVKAKNRRCSESKYKRILGYRCHETRLGNHGYYEGRVDCTRRNHVMIYIYRQNT